MASIQAFRIDNIVYGAPDKRLGAVGTHIDLLTMAKHPYHEIKSVVGGVMEDECGGIVINFFRERRKKKKKSNTDCNVKHNGEQNEVLVHTNEEPVKLRYRFANIFKASTRKIVGQVFRRKS